MFILSVRGKFTPSALLDIPYNPGVHSLRGELSKMLNGEKLHSSLLKESSFTVFIKSAIGMRVE
jgi:hypothetical protein